MSEHLDNREARDPQRRELDLMGHLPGLVAKALKSQGWQRHLGDIDTTQINSRGALARLPVLRKSELPVLQKGHPPFGNFISDELERCAAGAIHDRLANTVPAKRRSDRRATL